MAVASSRRLRTARISSTSMITSTTTWVMARSGAPTSRSMTLRAKPAAPTAITELSKSSASSAITAAASMNTIRMTISNSTPMGYVLAASSR